MEGVNSRKKVRYVIRTALWIVVLAGMFALSSGCLSRMNTPDLPFVKPANTVPNIDPARVQLVARLEAMETDLLALRDKVERLQAAGGHETEIRDLTARIAAVERQLGLDSSSQGAAGSAQSAGPADQAGAAAVGPAPGAQIPGRQESRQASPGQTQQRGDTGPQGRTARPERPLQAEVPPVEPLGDELSPDQGPGSVEIRNEPLGADEAAFREAYTLVKQGASQDAVRGLEEFLKKFPKSRFVPNAVYWLGESLFAEGRYDEAVLQFDRIIKEFQGSRKELNARLKQGQCFAKMGDVQSARVILEALIKENPHTPQARLAKTQLTKLGEKGRK
jgi:tol-pal system protein YbgF